MNLLYAFAKNISHLISPPYCESCKSFIKQRTIFCKNCYEKIQPIVSTSLEINSEYRMNIFVTSDYKEPMKSLILAKGYSNILASKYLAELIWKMTNLRNFEFDYFVPVPLHWTRFIKRGFNQTEIIAKELSIKSGKPVKNILKRNRQTAYQSSCTVQNRVENVRNAFKLNIKDITVFKNKNLLIVDDLLTSGATLISVAKELVKLKPKSINAIVACKVI